jgi:hypothetical protein
MFCRQNVKIKNTAIFPLFLAYRYQESTAFRIYFPLYLSKIAVNTAIWQHCLELRGLRAYNMLTYYDQAFISPCIIVVLFSAVDSDPAALDPDLDVWEQIRILALMTQYQFFGVFKSHKYFIELISAKKNSRRKLARIRIRTF